jgi:hypothetical protein
VPVLEELIYLSHFYSNGVHELEGGLVMQLRRWGELTPGLAACGRLHHTC